MLPFAHDNKYLQDKYEADQKAMRVDDDHNETDPIFNVEVIPYELNLFFRSEVSFLPPNKTFEDLTPKELQRLKGQYRFSPFRPGIYQGITGMSGPGCSG